MSNKNPRDQPRWSDPEDRFLMSTYPDSGWSITRIAEELGRTRDAVKVRAQFCGVKRPKRGAA